MYTAYERAGTIIQSISENPVGRRGIGTLEYPCNAVVVPTPVLCLTGKSLRSASSEVIGQSRAVGEPMTSGVSQICACTNAKCSRRKVREAVGTDTSVGSEYWVYSLDDYEQEAHRAKDQRQQQMQSK